MKFQERELKPYANTVPAEELCKGNVYFSVTFFDEEMLIPLIETMVFVDSRQNEKNIDEFLFQDVISHQDGVKFDQIDGIQDFLSHQDGLRFDQIYEDGRAIFFICSKNGLNSIFQFEDALDCLLACSLKRKAAKVEEARPILATAHR